MRIRTQFAALTVVALLFVAFPADASKWDGTVMFGMITLDQSYGDRSSVQETYNIYNGFNVTQLQLKGGPNTRNYFSLNLREINLDSRKGDFLYRIPGTFQFGANYRQHRQIFDSEGYATSSRKNFGFDAYYTPTQLIRLTADYNFQDRDGDRLEYPAMTEPGWLGFGYDYTLHRAAVGIELNRNQRGAALRYEFTDFKNRLDSLTDRRGHVVSARITTPFDFYPKWTHFLRGAYGWHELVNADTDYKLLNLQYTSAIAPLDWFKFRYNLYMNRVEDSVTTFHNDNVSNSFDVDFFYRYGRLFGGYSFEILDDDRSLTDYNSYRLGGSFNYKSRVRAKVHYANREKTDKGQNTLLQNMESDRIRGDLSLTLVKDYLTIGGNYINGEREFTAIGQKSTGERANGYADLAYPGWGSLIGNYTYRIEKYTNLDGTFETNSNNVTSRFVFNRLRGLDLTFGLSYIDIGKDLDIEKSILFFGGKYVSPQGLRIEVQYNVYNYDDYLILDRYYTGNIVWVNLGYDFSFGSGLN